jgi:hypothetical protein
MALALLASPVVAQESKFELKCKPFNEEAARQPFDDLCNEGKTTDPGTIAQDVVKDNFCANGTPITIDIATLKKLQTEVESPAVLGPKYQPPTERSKLKNLATKAPDGTALGEGRLVQMAAFIFEAHYSDVKSGESVNCKLAGNENNDIHMALVAAPDEKDECQSVTTEITPHYRPAVWTDSALNALKGRPVRITGQLFFDASHHPGSGSNCQPPKRQSSWEIHPLYKFEVCSKKTLAECRADDDTAGLWLSIGGRGTPPTIPKIDPAVRLESVAPGGTVAIPVAGLKSSDKVSVTLSDGKTSVPAEVVPGGDGKIQFKVRPETALSRYSVTATVNDVAIPVPGELVVKEASKPVIFSVTPMPVYPPEKGKTFNFFILGDHLGNDADSKVEIDNAAHNPIEAAKDMIGNVLPCEEGADTPCIKVSDSGRRIEVHGYEPTPFQGSLKLRVNVGGVRSDPKDLTIVHYKIGTIRLLAFVVVLLLVVILWALVRRGVGEYRVGKHRYGVFTSFLIDKDTNSYSLSKLQLILWTSAAVFGYVYFFLCRVLVQWKLDFPDIPDGLPTLIGMAAGTSVAAAGLSSARGSKGAGPQSPTPADFISSGGVVIPERLQFFIWTIVGVLGFIFVVWTTNPSLIAGLPSVPANFLALAGISSAGYLAGKAVRRPGPVIQRADASQLSDLIIDVLGQNFEETAAVRIDRVEQEKAKITKKTLQDQTSGTRFYSEVQYQVPWQNSFASDKHTLEIVNGDGQSATVDFTLALPKITAPSAVEASKSELTITLAVENLTPPVELEWKPPGETTAVKGKTAQIDKQSVTATFAPGLTEGVGQIALIDANGSRALAPVTIVASKAKDVTVSSGAGDVAVLIEGENLPSTIKEATWTPPTAKKQTKLDTSKIDTTGAPKKLTVTLNPGTVTGAGVLTLVTSSGYNFDITIAVK